MKTFEQAIKAYLDNRAGTDQLFAKTYAKENKSIKECCNYIIQKAKKRGNAVAMTDEEVYGLAVHYYDEDSLIVSTKSQSVKIDVSVEEYITELQENVNTSPSPSRKTKEKKQITRAVEEDPRQLSLF